MIDRTAFVYVMRRADGIRKVGCAFNPDQRCLHLSNEMDIEYVIENGWEMDNAVARAVERAVHKALKPHKHRLYEKIEYYRLPLKRIIAEVERVYAMVVAEREPLAAKKLKLSRVQVIKRMNRIRENRAADAALKIGAPCNGK